MSMENQLFKEDLTIRIITSKDRDKNRGEEVRDYKIDIGIDIYPLMNSYTNMWYCSDLNTSEM